MEEYSFQNPGTSECCLTHRPFQPEEEFIAVLFEANGGYVRKDYSLEAWESNPPEKYHAMWRMRMPSAVEPRKSKTAVNDVLLGMFDEMYGTNHEPDKLYVLSLLLVRRRIMRLEELFNENSANVLSLYSQFRDEYYQIPVVNPTPERQEQIQSELTDILVGNEPQPPKKILSQAEEDSIQFWDPDAIEIPEVGELPPELQ